MSGLKKDLQGELMSKLGSKVVHCFCFSLFHHPLLLFHLIDLHLRYLLLQNELDTHKAFLEIEKNSDVNFTFDKILTTLATCNGKEKIIVTILMQENFMLTCSQYAMPS
jgi:hypothetical protein